MVSCASTDWDEFSRKSFFQEPNLSFLEVLGQIIITIKQNSLDFAPPTRSGSSLNYFLINADYSDFFFFISSSFESPTVE